MPRNWVEWTSLTHKKAIDMYKQGCSIKDISEEVGHSEAAIYRYMNRSGVVRTKTNYPKCRAKRVKRN